MRVVAATASSNVDVVAVVNSDRVRSRLNDSTRNLVEIIPLCVLSIV